MKNIQDNNIYMKKILDRKNKFIFVLGKIISSSLDIVFKIIDIFLNFILFFILISYYIKYGILAGLFIGTIFYSLYTLNKKYLNFSNCCQIIAKSLMLSFLLINIFFVFYYNRSYYESYKNNNQNSDINTLMCINEVFNDSIEMPAFALPPRYKYHAPKSNLFLPTLGIRYKENYEEERGIVVVYEKHSYFNLYVGDGRVLCSTMETLE